MPIESISREFIINKEWRITKKIGAGSFGEIYSCINVKTNRQAAVKMEKFDPDNWSQLNFEYKILQKLKGNNGFCQIYWFGRDGMQNLYRALVMEQLGPSLDDLHIYCELRFSTKTVGMLADQMIKRMQHLHQNSLLHRDVKPENFLMGNKENFNTVYLIDFGLSKQYLDPTTKGHIPFRSDKNLTGTARYCSINTHEGYEQSRRDDMEALGHVLIYLLLGHLPWQGLPVDSKEDKFMKIHEMKKVTSLDELCQNIPNEFYDYLTYCRGLDFKEDPDYFKCRQMFWNMMERLNLKYDFQFDWLSTSYY